MKRILMPMALLACGALFIGCESLTEPEAALDDQTLESSFDITAQDTQVNLLQAAGVNVDSANGFFLLNWNELLKPRATEAEVVGHAAAVAFGSTLSVPRSNTPGVDMGMVTLTINQTSFELPKITFGNAGVRYGIMRPRGGHGPRPGGLGQGGPRDGRGGPRGDRGHSPLGRDSLNVPFVSGGLYQFAASGATEVPALNFEIQAPLAFVQIGGVANDESIDVTQDLTITWTGDATVSNMTLVLAPAFHRGRFHGGNQGRTPVMITLDPAAGSYTITAQTLQDVLGDANGLMLHLAQGTHREVTQADGTKYVVGVRVSDSVRLKAD